MPLGAGADVLGFLAAGGEGQRQHRHHRSEHSRPRAGHAAGLRRPAHGTASRSTAEISAKSPIAITRGWPAANTRALRICATRLAHVPQPASAPTTRRTRPDDATATPPSRREQWEGAGSSSRSSCPAPGSRCADLHGRNRPPQAVERVHTSYEADKRSRSVSLSCRTRTTHEERRSRPPARPGGYAPVDRRRSTARGQDLAGRRPRPRERTQQPLLARDPVALEQQPAVVRSAALPARAGSISPHPPAGGDLPGRHECAPGGGGWAVAVDARGASHEALQRERRRCPNSSR